MPTNPTTTIIRLRWRMNMHHLGKEKIMMDMLLLLSKMSIINRIRMIVINNTTHSNKAEFVLGGCGLWEVTTIQ